MSMSVFLLYITLYLYYELMNFWSCKLVNLSKYTKKSSSYSYWQWQQICTFMSICHDGPEYAFIV